jgi:F0F1-type ATP synthase gamma subunit
LDLSYEYIISDDVQQSEYQDLMQDLKDAMLHKTYRTIRIHFQYFVNTLKQKPVTFQLYPFTQASFEQFAEMIGLQFHDHGHIPSVQVKLEPNKIELVNKIRNMLINYVLYAAILHGKT